MLGANDFKTVSDRSVEDAVSGLGELITIIQTSTYGPDMRSSPRTLLIGYPFLSTENGIFADIFKGADEKSRNFPALCADLAEKHGYAYLDMSPHIEMGEDGLHFDRAAHPKFAQLVTEKIALEELKNE
ncbi:MAG: hypothetical protein Q7V63_04775 [Gammaproteobacteria bacterium]|nr:hypothetical protein [Gammaproteobacteria bacterium]